MGLSIKQLSRRFQSFQALDGIDLDIAEGEFIALLGPSGSGKTSLLRILAGLDDADQGSVQRDGENLLALEARHRQVGMVFQHYALFAHLKVADNIAFGLRVKPRGQRPSRAAIRQRVAELLRRVQLEEVAQRYPSQLSGGQRQRVALARALAIEPRLLLLDEPFGALDAQVRLSLRRWLRQLHQELGLTTLFVTHDQDEALALADRVVVMNRGRIEQIGTPAAIYQAPATPFVYEFLGRCNRLPFQREGERLRVGPWLLQAAPALPAELQQGHAYARPGQWPLRPLAADDGWHGQLQQLTHAAEQWQLSVALQAPAHTLELSWHQGQAELGAWRPGQPLALGPPPLLVFSRAADGGWQRHWLRPAMG